MLKPMDATNNSKQPPNEKVQGKTPNKIGTDTKKNEAFDYNNPPKDKELDNNNEPQQNEKDDKVSHFLD